MNRRGSTVLVHVALLAGGVVTLFPLLWMLSASFMSNGEATTFPPHLIPHAATLDQYRQLFVRLNLGRAFLSSATIAIITTLGSLLINSMAGYAFARLRFRGRDRLFGLLLAALIIPAQVGMLPLFLMMKTLHLVNSYWGAILPSLATVLGIFLIRQFMLSVPQELLEAARIEGASEWRIYWSVVMPLARPVLATLAILTFMTTWNDFMWPLIVLSPQNPTVQVALSTLAAGYYRDNTLVLGGTALGTLPVLLIFAVFGRQIISGIMEGAVKG
jgi:multiple sugar transport system permease protein